MNKAKEIKNTHKMVLAILKDNEWARTSDEVLYIEVCKRINNNALDRPFWYVMRYRKDIGFPPFETVRRTRQKVQEKHPELVGNIQVYVGRKDNEEVFIEYARS